MKTILLFRKGEWNKHNVTELLRPLSIKCDIRSGFGHLLAICDSRLDWRSLTASRITHTIIAVDYDHSSGMAGGSAFVVNSKKAETIALEALLDTEPNLSFDLRNFGFLPASSAGIGKLYDSIRRVRFGRDVDVLAASDCSDIIHDSNVPVEIRKSLLDVFTLRACALYTVGKLHSASNALSEYSSVFLASFVTRAQFEKLMLLMARIDEALDYKKLDSSKKMKATFAKQAASSQFPLTKRLLGLVADLELLDDNYRTPETHKMGRILGLVNSQHFGTMLNEVLSFQNDANNFFMDVCRHIRTHFSTQEPSAGG